MRTLFRWCRIFVWLLVLLTVGFVAYLHLIGLPDFLKRPLLQRLLASEVAAEFSNMQVGWRRGPTIIIENASFHRTDQALNPRLTASRAELALDWNALCRLRIHARSLDVANAEWEFPVSETPGDTLVLNNLALEMRFLSNDTVRVDTCRGVFRGTQIDLIGRVSHVKDLRRWIYSGNEGRGNLSLQANVQEFSRIVQKIHFTGTPVLRIEVGGDGQDMNSFHAEMNFGAAAAETPWGTVTNLTLNAACAHLADSGDQPFFHVTASSESLETRWAQGRAISFSSTLMRAANSNLNAEIRLEATQFNAPWKSAGDNGFGAARFSWNGAMTLASSNFAPLTAAGKLRATEPRTPWGSAREIALDGRAARIENRPPADATWGPWARFAQWTFDWQTEMFSMDSPKLRIDHVTFDGRWRAPQLTVENLKSDLYGGTIEARAMLDIASRELHCGGKADVNAHSMSQLLRRAERDWLAQLDWTAPPRVDARLRVVLPPWIDRPTNWIADVDSSLQIAGDFTAGPSSFSRVEMQSANGHFTFTNRTWHITRLHTVRPEGDVDLDYTTSAQGFHYIVDSRMDPRPALPLVAPGQPHLLDQFDFHQPPVIHAEIWGSWREAGRTGVIATVRAKDFTFRGEPMGAVTAAVEYTNLLLDVRDFHLSNSLCQADAPWVHVDFGTKTVRLASATGMLNPLLVQHLLRPNAPDWLNLVHFDSPPTISVAGSFSLTNGREADLHFLVTGQGMHYTNLVADHVSGNVDWSGLTVTVTNIAASLYHGGSLMGWIVFPGGLQDGPDFRADFTARNIDLSAFATGFSGKTNHVEGRLDVDVSLAGPRSQNGFDWQGGGRVHVHDALLWDIKLFGLLSPVLNLISPGWGHSRAREAAADFIITNGVVSSDDLEVRCQGFRLYLRGTVDRNKRINGRLEAILSRDTPIIGSFLSLAFTPLSKLFEYHVSGPVNDPVLEPVYVPKFIMLMLHPFHAFKSHSNPEPPPPPKDTK